MSKHCIHPSASNHPTNPICYVKPMLEPPGAASLQKLFVVMRSSCCLGSVAAEAVAGTAAAGGHPVVRLHDKS